MPGAIYNILHAHAVQNYGFVTTRQAREVLGVNPHRLQVMNERGLVRNVSRGVFRFPDIPPTSLDQYMAATLWPLTRPGVLGHATALDLHDLCDVNPSRIHVTVPPDFRTTREPPRLIELHRRRLPQSEVTWHEGIPVVTVKRAILDGIEQALGWGLIDQAIDTARQRGRITAPEAEELGAKRPTLAS